MSELKSIAGFIVANCALSERQHKVPKHLSTLNACNKLLALIEKLEVKLEWVSIEDRLPDRYPVWLYHKDWIDQDFNPAGTRDGFAKYGNPDNWISAQWDGNLGRYVTSSDVPTHWQRQFLPPIPTNLG